MAQTMILSVEGMSCACVRPVTRALDGITGAVRIDVDLRKSHALVEHLREWVDEVGLIVAEAGCQARVAASGIQGDMDVRRATPSAPGIAAACVLTLQVSWMDAHQAVRPMFLAEPLDLCVHSTC